MSWAHFRALIWLRWRLRMNHWKRVAPTIVALQAAVAALAVLLALGVFAGFLLAGRFALAEASALELMYVWDGLAAGFLFFWIVGLVAELQRSEALSLDKFLHLPVSLSGAFFVNYLSSLLNLSLVLFVPSALGLSLGLASSRGPGMLLLIPLVFAFLLMVTALTHQFQGWLASLMVNRRRRRTIIGLVTMMFVLLAQLPNLLNMHAQRGSRERIIQLDEQREALDRALREHRITAADHDRQWDELGRDFDAETTRLQQWEIRTLRWVNLLLPPGWLPLGALALAEGRLLVPLWGVLGMCTIGGLSLARSYRTTLRIYTGAFTGAASRKRAAPVAAPSAPLAGTSHLLERRLPWLSEPAAAVALGTFRSLSRAPEVRMALLSSIIMLVLVATGLVRMATSVESSRPLLAFAIMAFVLLGLLQLAGNQFGLDRGGFQTFVLSGVRRRDILLGKNLALAPVALGIPLAIVAIGQCVAPLGLDSLLAVPPQFISMYLVFCLLANWLSILAPVRIPAGALRGSKPGVLAVVLQLLACFVFYPAAIAPLLLPIGVRHVADELNWGHGYPLCSVLAFSELAAVIGIYWLVIARQGQFLQAHEQRVLATVRTQPE